MGEFIISIGVHSTELNAARSKNAQGQTYAQELKRMLKAQGHHVQIVPRPTKVSSTKDMLEFNRQKMVLTLLLLWKRYQNQPTRLYNNEKQFVQGLTENECNVLDVVLKKKGVNRAILGMLQNIGNVPKLLAAFDAIKQALIHFPMNSKIFHKANAQNIEFFPQYSESLQNHFLKTKGDLVYRRQLSERFPHATIIDLHNSAPGVATGRTEWRHVAGMLVRSVDTKKEYSGGLHSPTQTNQWIVVEIPADSKRVKTTGSYGARFFRNPESGMPPFTRQSNSDMETRYGTYFFPARGKRYVENPQLKQLAEWLHGRAQPQTTRRRLRR